MVDLSPDVSMYKNSGIGGMKLGDLVWLADKAQDLESTQAVSNAMRKSFNPVTKTFDFATATQHAVASGARIRPESMMALSDAGRHQSENLLWKNGQMADSLIPMLRPGSTLDDYVARSGYLTRAGMDPKEVNDTALQAVGPDGRTFDPKKLADVITMRMGQAGLQGDVAWTLPDGTVRHGPPTAYIQEMARAMAEGRPGPIARNRPPGAADINPDLPERVAAAGQRTNGPPPSAQQPGQGAFNRQTGQYTPAPMAPSGGQPSPRPGLPPAPWGNDPIGYSAAGFRPTPMTAPTSGLSSVQSLSPNVSGPQKESSEEYERDRDVSANFGTKVQGIKAAHDLLGQMKGSTLGLGSEEKYRFASFMNTYGNPLGIKPLSDEEMIKREKVGKYLAQFVNEASKGSTNARMDLTEAAGPSLEKQIETNRSIAAQIYGNMRYTRAKYEAFNRTGNPNPGFYKDFGAQWGPKVNPDAFKFSLLSPDEKAALVKGTKNRVELMRLRHSIEMSDQLDQMDHLR